MYGAADYRGWRKGQQPGMTQRSCDYSGGPGTPRPELNTYNTVEFAPEIGEDGGGAGGGWGGILMTYKFIK